MASQDFAFQKIFPVFSSDGVRRRVALWGGAVIVACVAILFAKASDYAFETFTSLIQQSLWWALLITPTVFALLTWLTAGILRPTRGSGIPQVIAALERYDQTFRGKNLSILMSAGKLFLTTLALLGGASVGREGPTVHIGASVMYQVGRLFRFRDPYDLSHFLLAGGASGIAAAFNAPLAGVVFAIEELSGRFEHRFSGTLLTAVIVGGVVSLGLLGNYTYFGKISVSLPLDRAWIAIILCGVSGGLLGGSFALTILASVAGKIRWLNKLRSPRPILFAAACGLSLVALAAIAGHGAFGTGYAQARSLLQGTPLVGHEFGVMKWIANFISNIAGIPGGLFSSALAVGAGIGYNLSVFLPDVDPHAMVLLGMCAYLTGLTQAPLTSAVISMELTDTGELLLPILATVLLARGVSGLICKTPIYRGMADLMLEQAQEAQAQPEAAARQEAQAQPETAARQEAQAQPEAVARQGAQAQPEAYSEHPTRNRPGQDMDPNQS